MSVTFGFHYVHPNFRLMVRVSWQSIYALMECTREHRPYSKYGDYNYD